MKKVLIVQGGERPNGNTSQLVRAFVKGAEEADLLVFASPLYFWKIS